MLKKKGTNQGREQDRKTSIAFMKQSTQESESDDVVEGVYRVSEVLKEIKEFHMETTRNIGVLQKKINNLRDGIRTGK